MPLTIEIKVVPSSGKQCCQRDKSGKIKCYLKSAPEGGKANAELIKFLSKKLSLPQDQLMILQGATSRNKVIKIDADLVIEQLFASLGLEDQKSIV